MGWLLRFIVSRTSATGMNLSARVRRRHAPLPETHAFASQFSSLSRELGVLKTKVATEALQKQIGALEAQLENTRKALDPPKATLSFTFAPFELPPLGQPLNLI